MTHFMTAASVAFPPSASPWRQTAAASRSCPPGRRSAPDHPAVSSAGKWDPSVFPSEPPDAPSSPSQSDGRNTDSDREHDDEHNERHLITCVTTFTRKYTQRDVRYHTHQIPLQVKHVTGEKWHKRTFSVTQERSNNCKQLWREASGKTKCKEAGSKQWQGQSRLPHRCCVHRRLY